MVRGFRVKIDQCGIYLMYCIIGVSTLVSTNIRSPKLIEQKKVGVSSGVRVEDDCTSAASGAGRG